MNLIRVVVTGLAAYRLARALTVDTITQPFRQAVWERAYEGVPYEYAEDVEPTVKSRPWSWFYGLVSCGFCAGWWASLAIAAAWFGAWTIGFAVAAVASAGACALFVAFDHRMMS